MIDPTRGLFKVPTKEERIAARAGAPLNPFKLLGMMNTMQTLMFFSGYIAWTMDAWDFFSVSLNVSRLATAFDKEPTQITTSITLTLLFRSLGALIFGAISDRYGRKWPLVGNLLIIAVLSLGTGFCNSFGAFLAVRSLFGIGMGGIWGLSAATALENAPAAARGLLSGILQQGYAFGYLLAASVNLSPWMERTQNWRILFYLGAGLSLFAALVRAALPESDVFKRAKLEREQNPEEYNDGESKTKRFLIEFKNMLKTHWFISIYGILLMTGFNFLSHSSQDLYPTMIQNVKLAFLPKAAASFKASQATIVGNCGAIAGGLIAGYISQYLGRRLTIVVFVFVCGCLIPAWILPNTFSGLAAGAFWIQFCVQGAWGVIPIYLQEISPAAFRALWAGLAYQLGNMVSSASAQIETRGGDNIRIRNPKCPIGANGVITCPAATPPLSPTLPDYATVSGILLGVVCAYLLIVVTFMGNENRGSHFEQGPVATARGAGKVHQEDLVGGPGVGIVGVPAASERGGYSKGDDIEHVGDARQPGAHDDSSEKYSH
ncbi:MFS general substrate transporter [Jaminaea rosea]|uniref:MFS general substrate transporter n=1 Tax=Jaminaea rosea TaxID=1569628 RepID=A0A316UZV2_9BASI|nr:MFS general substrate transporter [Jaminaea rosea]PWN30288.1 MFS general substrate transporter [Jaminaea rosea]